MGLYPWHLRVNEVEEDNAQRREARKLSSKRKRRGSEAVGVIRRDLVPTQADISKSVTAWRATSTIAHMQGGMNGTFSGIIRVRKCRR